MKKNNIFYACAAAALMFASCQKEGPSAEVTEPASTDLKVITASAVQTKVTTQDGVNVLWENGDVIKLFTRTWNESGNKYDASWCDYKTTLNSPAATATFARDENNTNFVDNTSGKYLACYLKEATVVTQSRNYNAPLALNKEQKAKNGGGIASSIMVSTSQDTDFQFSHLVSYVKFTVDANTTPFNKLTVTSVDDSKYVVSRIMVDWAGDLTTTVLPTNPSNGSVYTQSSKTVSLVTDDGANFAPGTYYMAINPDTYAEGLEFTFENGEAVYSKVTPTNVVMTPGAVADMGTIGTLKFPKPSDKIGTVYAENGVNQGVVFWVDENDSSKGKIISGAVTELKWGNGTAKTYTWAADIDTDNGLTNHNYIINIEGSSASEYPAVYFCENLEGEGWYLPSVKDMQYLAIAYFGIVGQPVLDFTYYGVEGYTENAAMFDAALAECVQDDEGTTAYDESKIAVQSNCWYWTGQGSSSDQKIRRVKLATKYYEGSGGANNLGYIRCVRDVVLK
mgnify:CR=1 FL=1